MIEQTLAVVIVKSRQYFNPLPHRGKIVHIEDKCVQRRQVKHASLANPKCDRRILNNGFQWGDRQRGWLRCRQQLRHGRWHGKRWSGRLVWLQILQVRRYLLYGVGDAFLFEVFTLWSQFLCSLSLLHRKLDAKSRSPYSIMMTKRTVPPPWPFGSLSYDSWATCLIRNRRHLIHLNAMNPSWAKFTRHLVEPHARNRSWLIKQSRKNRNLLTTGPFLGGNCTWHRNPALCNTET